MASGTERYKDKPLKTNLFSGILGIVLGIEIAACVIATAITLWPRLIFLPAANPIYWSIIYSLRFLPSLTTTVMLIWIFCANANARALSSEALDDTPGWAVGWFFIPLVSLVKPQVIMQQIYLSSRRPLGWREDRDAAIVMGWWLIRLLADLIGLTTLTTRFGPDDVVTNGIILFCVLTVIHQVIFLIIVTRINRWQIRAHRTEAVF